MKIVLVHGYLQLGGIETLLLKLARELDALGHDVSIVAGPEGNPELERQLSQYATLQRIPVSLARGYPLAGKLDLAGTDVFFACGAPSLVFAESIRGRFAPTARLLAGVYLPWEYFGSEEHRRYDWALSQRLFSSLPDENIVFMNEACRTEHQLMLGRTFARSPIIPLPVDVAEAQPVRQVDRGKIVTVGRVVEFKVTTWRMLDVVADLRRLGKAYTYHVYGDGTGMPAFRDAIRQRGLEDAVVLHGTIDYHAIPAALADAFVFVGYATAAIEAAARGVPTLVGVESESAETLGFVHETREGELGEQSSLGRRYQILDRILELEALSPAAYTELSQREAQHVARYATRVVVPRYLEAFEGALPFRFPVGLIQYVRTLASIALWKVKELFGSEDPDRERYKRRSHIPRARPSSA